MTCRNLQTLEIPSVTDNGLEQIGRLTSLEELYLRGASYPRGDREARWKLGQEDYLRLVEYARGTPSK